MFIAEEQVRSLLLMEDLIPAMAHGLKELSAGKVQQPMRVVVPVSEHNGFLGIMPAYAASPEVLGAKLVTFYPGNKGLPTHHAMIQLFRPETGEPLVTIDGRLITEMRTAAVSAVATDSLAQATASVLAILGSGVQARSHLEALQIVRNISEVRVCSPHHATDFVEWAIAKFSSKQGSGWITATKSAEEAVRGAHLVVTATSATTPALAGEWLSPGVHINAVGATRPDWRELDNDVLKRAHIFVELRGAAERESGDVIAARSIGAVAEHDVAHSGGGSLTEIGEVLAGAKPGRQSAEEITLFKSVGVAMEDVIAAEIVYQRAASVHP